MRPNEELIVAVGVAMRKGRARKHLPPQPAKDEAKRPVAS